MTHLYIELNTGLTEEVNSSIISKLYELAISGDLDNTSDLKGRLHSTTGYVSLVNYLNNNFQDLTILCDNLYVEFLDPTVASILATNFGDGVGIILTTVNSMTSFGGKFAGSSITSFNELSQFTNITEINNNNRFNSCTSLTSINLSNITKISGKDGYLRWNFEYCSNLESVGDTSNCTYFGQAAFNGCSKLNQIDLSNATHIGNSAFFRCSSLSTVVSMLNILTIGYNAFRESSNILEFSTLNLPNLTGNLGASFISCTQILHITNLGTLEKETSGAANEGAFHQCTNLLDAVLPETFNWIGLGMFNRCNNLRWIKILSTQVPTYNLTDGYGNVHLYGYSFGESYGNGDVANEYLGSTYPIYVKDELLSQYQVADGWKYVGSNANRLKPLSQFATDFPNE